MIFESETLVFEILGVMELEQGSVALSHICRKFDALSFRFQADTEIRSGGKGFSPGAGSVGFFPAMVEYDRFSRHDHLIAVHFRLINCHGQVVEFCMPEDPEQVGELFRRILDTWNRKEPGYRHRCCAILYEIFSLLYQGSGQTVPCNEKIRGAVDYLTENLSDPEVSIGEAAARSFVSEVYLRKLFQREFGVSPKQYLIQLRMKHAVELMASGYYSLQEISELCGYTDHKYFSTEFKRIMGVSPSRYRA